MSYDLYFWPAGATPDPTRLARRLADEKVGRLPPDERVLAFRADLLRRWPELTDRIAPWHDDLGRRQPWGRTDLADRFVGLTLPFGWPATDALPVLAGAHGLDCYDPQVGHLLVSSRNVGLDGASEVGGSVGEANVVPLLRRISGHIGYAYDDLDADALTGALDGTDAEADRWFDYPLSGRPVVNVALARSGDGSVVMVRARGELDLVLASRIETAIDLL
ncbi:hypothetical protein O7635_26860 [Asanoa sp. WMMD1127]|uniref:hypothetical protein n=1 Tax=Asanoa sp. WMMD1127 TaxID=3016107 RepID=UPI0024172FDC|nr:hypothetical protein [Asanoa sp. WMMD1127]MDG4825484.1 hypothetical protein [Asanoa sp. WMMD1127]